MNENLQFYLIALGVEVMNIGQSYTRLPLHCTLAFWFRLDIPLSKLTDDLAQTVADHKPVPLQAEKAAFTYGTTKTGRIPLAVSKVTITPELRSLHLAVKSLLDKLGAEYVCPDFLGDTYKAHITHVGSRGLADGETYVSDTIYVVTAKSYEYDYPRQPVATIQLTY